MPNLHLLPLTNCVSAADVLSASPTGTLYACDFGVDGAEIFTPQPWGYEQGRIINIDHHADTPVMRRRVSSTNLALSRVEAHGIASTGETVVINHTDCDSVLSAALLCGDLEPTDELGVAAIAADHTGDENAIADLLQALDKRRDYGYSLDNLRRLLKGQTLDADAQTDLDKRSAQRQSAAELVASGGFVQREGVAYAVTAQPIFGELLPPLLPDARLILLFSPRPGDETKWNCKTRIGNAAPADFPMSRLIKAVDAGYGGRWNAGSNTRSGGSAVPPEIYVELVIEQVKSLVTLA